MTVVRPAASAGLVIVLAVLTAACGATSHGGPLTVSSPAANPSVAPASNLADIRSRPRALPAVGANHACPITPFHDLAPVVNGGKGKGPSFGFGPGPAYLSGIVQIYPGGFDNEVWLIEPAYEGAVLVRGHQINGNGLVEFQEPITFRAGDGFSSAGSPPPWSSAICACNDPELGWRLRKGSLGSCGASRNPPASACEFPRCLYRVITTLAHDSYRSQSRRVTMQGPAQAASNPVEIVERRAGDEAMRRAIRGLGLRERQAVYLRYFEDLSFAEAARIMGARQGTVRVLGFRALGKLRRELTSSRGSDQVAI